MSVHSNTPPRLYALFSLLVNTAEASPDNSLTASWRKGYNQFRGDYLELQKVSRRSRG